MSGQERTELLRSVDRFAGCNDDQLRSLARLVDEVSVPAGTLLAEQGRLCHQFVIVVSGVLETCRSGRRGWLGPKDTIGWEAMRDRGDSEATVSVQSQAHLLVMSHQQFQAGAALAQPAARKCVIPAPPATDRRNETATHLR